MSTNDLKKKILVIDDDDLVRKSVQNLLSRAGYQVVSASDAVQAINEIRQQPFDLIVSDIRMPKKNGVETVREIRSIVNQYGIKDIPIIFITGYASESEDLKAELFGEIILKPFDLEHLLVTVREYL